MSYASTIELQARVAVWPALYRAADGSFDATAAQADLDAASAEIDSFAGERYVVPVEPASALPLLKGWTLTLAEELAHARYNSTTGELPAYVKDRVSAARDALARLADGKIALGGAVEIESSAGGAAIVECDPPVMTRERLGGY